MKKTALLLFTAASCLVLAVPAAAQIGPWSRENPLWIDSNSNGVIDAGEVTMYPRLVGSTQPTGTSKGTSQATVGRATSGNSKLLEGTFIVLEGNPWDPDHTYDTKLYPNAVLNPTFIEQRRDSDGLVHQVNTSNGYQFSLVETNGSAQTASGASSFVDLDGDGVYETLRVSGSKGGAPIPQTDIGFIFHDSNGDGKADWVSIPWALSGLLGVRAGDPQIWAPLTADGAGRPITVSVQMPDPANPGQSGGIDFVVPIVPAAQGGPNLFAIPTLSTAGLLALALSLVAAGVLLVRGRIFA